MLELKIMKIKPPAKIFTTDTNKKKKNEKIKT